MGMCMSPQLSMRQFMEERLSMEMYVKQKMVLVMLMYMKREDICTGLYRQALERGDVRTYVKHGLTFEYARVYRNEVPKNILDSCGCGFSHCLYNFWDALFHGRKYAYARGSWLLFVVPDYFTPTVFPEHFLEYIAVHEHGEEVTLGEHYLASKLEFSIAKLERKLMAYVDWLERTAPSKFADMFSHQTRVVLPEESDFQSLLEMASKSEYATRVRTLIENFEWPAATLNKLDMYERKGKEAQTQLLGMLTRLKLMIDDKSITTPLTDVVDDVRQGLEQLSNSANELRRFLCLPNLQELYEEFRRDIASAYDRFRIRRQESLQQQVDGLDTYLAEVGQAGDSLPVTGVFSLNVREMMEATLK